MEPNPGSAGWWASPICRARPHCKITERKSLTASSAISTRTTIKVATPADGLYHVTTMSRIPNFADIAFEKVASAGPAGSAEAWLTPEGIPVKSSYGESDLDGID